MTHVNKPELIGAWTVEFISERPVTDKTRAYILPSGKDTSVAELRWLSNLDVKPGWKAVTSG
jgi:hypothetical protein